MRSPLPRWTAAEVWHRPDPDSRFLSRDVSSIVRMLITDLINFCLILVFYLACISVGRVMLILDQIFKTQFFECFVQWVEEFDSSMGKQDF